MSARPEHAAGIDAQRITPVDVIVEHRGQQVVRGRDRVEVAGEMQVDVGHRHDLGLTTAGRSTLLSEAGAEARLPERDRGLLAEPAERIAQPDRRRGLAFTGLRGIDRRHQNQMARRAAGERLHIFAVELRLVASIGFERVFRDAEPCGDVVHGLLDCAPCDLDIRHGNSSSPIPVKRP